MSNVSQDQVIYLREGDHSLLVSHQLNHCALSSHHLQQSCTDLQHSLIMTKDDQKVIVK